MAAELLQLILEEAWLTEAFPEERTDGIIEKIDRIKDHLFSTIRREQAGFRSGSSCVDHINTLRLSKVLNSGPICIWFL